MSRYDVVFFDVAGTLMEVRGSVGEIYARIARDYGVTVDPARLERDFVASFRAQSSDPCLLPEDADQGSGERRWWRELVFRVFAGHMKGARFDAYFDDVFEFFRTADAWQLFPDTIPTLLELRQLGYRVAILSNFDSRLDDLLPSLGLDGLVEQVILSWRIGAAKPDSRIFHRALEAMNVRPGRAVHVGDSPLEDAEGALAAGLSAILLDRRAVHRDWRGGPRIETLAELPALL